MSPIAVWVPSVDMRKQAPKWQKGRMALAGVLAVVVALLSVQASPSTFVPPPMESPVAITSAVGVGPFEWCQRSAAADAAIWAMRLKQGLNDGMKAADNAVASLDHGTRPVPITGHLDMMKKDSPLSAAIEPLTKLFMKYRNSIKPRCKSCQIVVRFGRLLRTCTAEKRHKARQPGMSKFKRKMGRFNGFTKMSNYRR